MTALVSHAASSSLLEHCRNLGVKNDPRQYGTSVPGGVWGVNEAPLPRVEHFYGVPIKRVDHKMNFDSGMIFTPKDYDDAAWASALANVPPALPPAPASISAPAGLKSFCAALGAKHNPVAYSSSIPGGCWAGSARSPSLNSEDMVGGIAIRRVDHKMNETGMIFTPSQNIPFMSVERTCSTESEQDDELSQRQATASMKGRLSTQPPISSAPTNLTAFCAELGAKHNPAAFSSSVPGGIWAGSARSHSDKSEDMTDGIAIHRVDHKMNDTGMIFTPLQGASFMTHCSSSMASSYSSELGSSPPRFQNVGNRGGAAFLASATAAVAAATAAYKNASLSAVEEMDPLDTAFENHFSEEVTKEKGLFRFSDDENEEYLRQMPSVKDIETSPTSANSGDDTPMSTRNIMTLVARESVDSRPVFSNIGPRWMDDNEVHNCCKCDLSFSIYYRRKHHCRACGKIFCSNCSSTSMLMPRLGYTKPERACDDCSKLSH